MSLSLELIPSDSRTTADALRLDTTKSEIVLLSASITLFVNVCAAFKTQLAAELPEKPKSLSASVLVPIAVM